MQPRRPLPLRIAYASSGGILVLLGVVGLFVPVMPGWVLIVPGLGLLAREFVWARRLLDRARNRLESTRQARRRDDRKAA